MTCGHCKEAKVSLAHVQDCAAEEAYWAGVTASELAAEAANERWFEERGGPVDDPFPYHYYR